MLTAHRALEWAKQGHQKRLDRDENTGQFTIPANMQVWMRLYQHP